MQVYVQFISNLNWEFYIWSLLKLILLLSVLFDYIVKVIKSLYGILKVSNYWFATYYIYYKDKLRIIKSIYNLYFFYNSNSFGIVRVQINNILILIDNNFASTEENAMRSAKIMTKNTKYFISIYLLKFNGAQIKFIFNKIILSKKSYVKGLFLVIDYAVDSTSFKKIIQKKLFLKK